MAKYIWFKMKTVPWIFRSFFLIIFGLSSYEGLGEIKFTFMEMLRIGITIVIMGFLFWFLYENITKKLIKFDDNILPTSNKDKKLGKIVFWLIEFLIFILFGVLAKINVVLASVIFIIYAVGTNLNVRIKR